ncbi:MAG: DUF2283 domain-containing protein [bacterium]
MDAHLRLSYDREGDILYLNAVVPYADQDSDEIADGVIARMNPETGQVENLEILFFSSRFENLDDSLPLPVGLKMTPPLAG